MEESIKVSGEVRFTKKFADGRIELGIFKNLVVTVGKSLLAKRLAGDSTEYITKLVFGTGSTAANVTDTALVSPSSPAYNVTFAYPAANSVKFVASMAPGEGNGNTFTEMGLMTAAGTLFSRLVLQTPVVKTSEYALDIEWTISFQ